MSQDLYDKAKMIIKKDACMKFYDASRHLYLELMHETSSLELDHCR